MISVNLTFDQLLEAFKNLSLKEKSQLIEILHTDDFHLSKNQQKLILEREAAYLAGKTKSYSIEELKAELNFQEP